MGDDFGCTLPDYVATLLQQGKKKDHPEFVALIHLYGIEHIAKMVGDYLAHEKEELEKRKPPSLFGYDD